jgi:hypothetical protein
LSSLWTIYRIAPAWNTGGHISSPHEKKPLAGQFGSIAIDGCAVLSQAACAAVAASRPDIVFIRGRHGAWWHFQNLIVSDDLF